MNSLILVDGHSLAYRMYFALERTQMKTSKQVSTWGVYGFFKALFDLVRQVEPDGMAVAFDKGRVTFRTEMYPEYKAHRQAMPDSLKEQMTRIRQGVDLLGIPVFELENYEADDLIGTIARQAASQGVHVTILTGDQDSFQVIDDEGRISILLPGFQGGLTRYDKQKVFEKLGVYPHQLTDFKGLKGDTSDNIPGVPGVGDKTAAKLLAQYQTLENVLAHAEEISGNKIRNAILTHKEQAILSKDLATIRYDAPVTFSDEACHLRIPDVEDFMSFLVEMEFRSFIQQSQTLLKPFLTHAAVGSPVPVGAGVQTSLLDLPPASASANPALLTTVTQSAEALLAHFQPPHRVITSMADLDAFLAQLKTQKVMVIDIETSGLDVFSAQLAGIALAHSPAFGVESLPTQNPLHLKEYPSEITTLTVNPHLLDRIEAVYIPLNHQGFEGALPEAAVLEKVGALLQDPDMVVVAHNAKFEMNVFRRLGIRFNGLVFDTMVASYVLNPDRRHGLKALAYDVLGHTMQEITELIGTGKKQIPFTQVPLDVAAPYAACDAYVTAELAGRLAPELSDDLFALFYEVELPTMQVLAHMEYLGVSLDTDYLSSLSKDLEAKLAVVEQDIYDEAGMTFNLNSPKQVGDVLFGHLKIPALGMTPTKSGYTTNAKVIEALAPDYPIVQKLLDYRQLFKLKSTYVDTLPQLINPYDHRLHTSFNQTIAATGRLSSSEPNLQNIPIRSDLGRQIRQGFVPKARENWLMMSADYSQIELRLLAHFSEDPNLLHAFQSGEDIHKATAALVFDVPLAEVTKDMRYRAKAVNFGIIYGQTAFGLSNALKIPPKEAAAFIDKYFQQYPNVKHYIETTKATVRATGRVKTICGRTRDFSEGLNSSNRGTREFTERAAFNMPLQGSAADIIKVAMVRLARALAREDLQSKLILQVHDELVLEVFEPELTQVRDLVTWAMTLEQPLKVPLEIDISQGPTWMEMD